MLHFNKPELGNFTKFIQFDILCINIQLLINQPYPSSLSASRMLSDHILTIHQIFPQSEYSVAPYRLLNLGYFSTSKK